MRLNLTAIAQKMAEDFFIENSPMYAIDATLGNGHDALFLSHIVSENGKVFGFDIQQSAIDSSLALFEKNVPKCAYQFFKIGHEEMENVLPNEVIGKVGCVFFNLGWFPRSDKSIATKSETTLLALEVALKMIDKNNGYLSVLCYRGHTGGTEEYCEVLNFFRKKFGDKFVSITDESNNVSPVILSMKFKGK